MPLGEAAQVLIDAMPAPRDPEAFLFAKYAGRRHTHFLTACKHKVCEDAKLRLHNLRHIAACKTVMSGENLPLTGMLLEHRRHETSTAYAYLEDEHLLEAVERVGALIEIAMRRIR